MEWKTRIIPAAVVYAVILYGCQGAGKNDKHDLVVGQWYNESLEVRLNAKNSPEDSVYSIPKGKWEETLNIQPILTTYRPDGSYRSEYKALDGTLEREVQGVWEIKGDTLYLTEEGARSGYYFKWMDGKAEFIGYLDWDQDGDADDLYTGVQIKK